ncbi:MAG: F-type H+-transporting ATPase subunit gamma [Salibacteraceae bacterium]|jgi:F-type H+-transporting ATPase subunit gamma
MANLKEIRTRITSVNSTMQITSAMKMVSAAKLKRAQDSITQMRPYAEKLQQMMSNLTETMLEMENPYATERPINKVLIIAINSNRGLCGGFNANIIKQVARMSQNELAGKEVTIYPIGKKAADSFKRDDRLYSGDVLMNHEKACTIFDNMNYQMASDIFQPVMDEYAIGSYDEVIVIYNQFKNAATQIVTTESLLPVKADESAVSSSENSDYIFQPGKEELLEVLIPNALKTAFYKGLKDSLASEHGARMTAMHKATDNASDLLGDLKLTYNKARQAAITTEILEIVGGAEALNG